MGHETKTIIRKISGHIIVVNWPWTDCRESSASNSRSITESVGAAQPEGQTIRGRKPKVTERKQPLY